MEDLGLKAKSEKYIELLNSLSFNKEYFAICKISTLSGKGKSALSLYSEGFADGCNIRDELNKRINKGYIDICLPLLHEGNKFYPMPVKNFTDDSESEIQFQCDKLKIIVTWNSENFNIAQEFFNKLKELSFNNFIPIFVEDRRKRMHNEEVSFSNEINYHVNSYSDNIYRLYSFPSIDPCVGVIIVDNNNRVLFNRTYKQKYFDISMDCIVKILASNNGMSNDTVLLNDMPSALWYSLRAIMPWECLMDERKIPDEFTEYYMKIDIFKFDENDELSYHSSYYDLSK